MIDTEDFQSSLVYEEAGSKAVYLSEQDISHALDVCPLHKPCICCGQQVLQQEKDDLFCFDGGFSQFGEVYHIFDFIYVLSGEKGNGVFDLAQIIDIQPPKRGKVAFLTVQWLGRWDDIVTREQERSKGAFKGHWPKDEVSFLIFLS